MQVYGVDGVVAAYRDVLGRVALSGPTYFGPILAAATEVASQNVSQVRARCSGCCISFPSVFLLPLHCWCHLMQAHQKYFMLLILTDGVINDMDTAIEAVVRASALPLSIVIVGVGVADFKDMRVLDADGGLLRSGPRTAVRDIVQFVQFASCEGDPGAIARVSVVLAARCRAQQAVV